MNKFPAKDCRSILYMPASNQRALDKGPNLAADAIIVDLEDSVGPEDKASARANAVSTFRDVDYGYRVKALRINAADTPWYDADVGAVASALPQAVVLPKADSVQDVLKLSAALDSMPGAEHIQIWAMMESVQALLNAQDIAAHSGARLTALILGNNDLARSANMRVSSDRTYLIPWIMQLLAVAHAHSLAMFDGVYNDFADTTGFLQECQQGAAMGMHGKTLIHPVQIAAANEHYSPSNVAVLEAKAIVDAFALSENQGVGVLKINGKMVERLHLQMAEQLLSRHTRMTHRA